jgi:Protein of unknown function (DUF2934)
MENKQSSLKSKTSSFKKRPAAQQPGASHEQIAGKAHEIWLAKGCPQGCDLENWLEAEQQLQNKSAGRLTGDFDEDARLTSEVEGQLDDPSKPAGPRSPTSLGI